jgi:hypothetical protein
MHGIGGGSWARRYPPNVQRWSDPVGIGIGGTGKQKTAMGQQEESKKKSTHKTIR